MIAALVAALSIAAVPAVGGAGAQSLQLFPVRGVFFPADAAESESMIRPEFRPLLLEDAAYFEEAFRKAFPHAAAALDEGNKRRTFAVSLQIARAARYDVQKPGGVVDVYLPLTASLYFTSITTGEVLYASTRTHIGVQTLTHGEAGTTGEAVRTAFAKNARELVDDLVGRARQEFDPVVIDATVRAQWKSLAILDAGAKRGLRAGDEVTSPAAVLRVVSVGASYAVAEPVLGTFVTGDRFERVATQLSDVNRPRVLPLIDGAPSGLAPDALVQMFSDALGDKAPLSLVPVNRTFGLVLNAIGAQADASQQSLRQRELPQFFVRLRVLEPIAYEGPTNKTYTQERVVAASALAELVDRSGRVLFAAHGRSRIRDEITDGIAFTLDARREAAVKNALLELANEFARGLSFATDALPVEAAGETIAIRDANGVLGSGSSCRAFRALGAIDGIEERVLVPTWELAVTESVAGRAVAATVLPIVEGAPAIERADVVLLDGVRRGAVPTRNRLGPCGAAVNIGAREIPDYTAIAMHAFAAGYPAAVYSPGFTSGVNDLVRSGAGFKQDLRIAEPAIDICVQPVYAVDAPEASCGRGSCTDRVRIRSGYRIRHGDANGEIRLNRAIEARLTATSVREAASPETRATSLTVDLIDQAFQLTPSLVQLLASERL